MNIGGRIIQDRNIFENDSDIFFAKYKGHEIHSSIFEKKERENNKYSYSIIKLKDRDNTIVCSGILQRCAIRDVIIYALNEANLR